MTVLLIVVAGLLGGFLYALLDEEGPRGWPFDLLRGGFNG